ncbi:uncharacterized protein BDZ99DRAFT_340507, partial [Mytilinidion resinicola]
LRVLRLHPGGFDDPISCELHVTRLRRGLSYEAISYVWGDPKDTAAIQCEGRPMHITVNLRDALRRFRDRKDVRTLWADAICIN